MSKISNTQRKYRVNHIKHEIPQHVTFRDKNESIKFNEKTINRLYDVIKNTVEIMDTYIPDNYCCTGGTLIGAIRHQGIIPWDDDADFLVMKKYLYILVNHIEKINKHNKKYVWTYIPFYGAIKISYRGHYIVDIMGIDIMDKKTKQLCYFGPDINGENTFGVSKYFYPYDKSNYDDIFPIKKLPFEDFEINCPNNYENHLLNNYSKNVLKEIVLPSQIHINNHYIFFGSTDSIWLTDMFHNIERTNPLLVKHVLKYISLLISYCMYNKSLSIDQKLCYLDYFIEK